MTYPTNSSPSNYTGESDTLSLGQIRTVDGAKVPMYREPEVAAALRMALMELHWFTHKASAHSQSIFIRFDGDNLFVCADNPINPDIPDPTAPRDAA